MWNIGKICWNTRLSYPSRCRVWIHYTSPCFQCTENVLFLLLFSYFLLFLNQFTPVQQPQSPGLISIQPPSDSDVQYYGGTLFRDNNTYYLFDETPEKYRFVRCLSRSNRFDNTIRRYHQFPNGPNRLHTHRGTCSVFTKANKNFHSIIFQTCTRKIFVYKESCTNSNSIRIF